MNYKLSFQFEIGMNKVHPNYLLHSITKTILNICLQDCMYYNLQILFSLINIFIHSTTTIMTYLSEHCMCLSESVGACSPEKKLIYIKLFYHNTITNLKFYLFVFFLSKMHCAYTTR